MAKNQSIFRVTQQMHQLDLSEVGTNTKKLAFKKDQKQQVLPSIGSHKTRAIDTKPIFS
jgi:hypothetical protein